MKKLIALLLILTLMIPAEAWACTESAPAIARTESAACVFTDASWWAITSDCRVAGIMRVDEALEFLPVQNAPGQFVAGKLPSGWAKYTAAVRTVDMGCQIAGLTRLDNATLILFPQFADIALVTIHNLLGEDVELSANTISACAKYWQGDFVSEIFFNSSSDGVQVGWAEFNGGADVTPLMLGHFDGILHFGLRTSDEIAPEVLAAQAAAAAQAQAEAEAAAQAQASAHASAQATAAAAVSVSNSGSIDNSGNGCYRNNTIVQINILSVIWQGIKNITNQSCAE